MPGHNRRMYVPPQFRSDDPAMAAAVMRAHPFASLVTTDDDGLPFVSHLPLHRVEQDGGWRLLGHLARPNPQWQQLQKRARAVVSFLGPHAYLSPSVYPDRQRVPTWNYLAVHCTVQATLVHEADGKDRLLKCLIADHEPAYADQWRSLPASYQSGMLAGIVGLELAVVSWQCKLKINQHRPEARQAMQAQYAAGNENERALAQWLALVEPTQP